MNWWENPYYFILWPVGVLALASLCCACLVRPLSEGRAKVWAGLILFLGCTYGMFYLNRAYANYHHGLVVASRINKPNWHAIMSEASGATRPVVVVEIPYGQFGNLPHQSTTGALYEKPPGIFVTHLRNHQGHVGGTMVARLYETMKEFDRRSDMLYLIMLDADSIGGERKQKIFSALRDETDSVIRLNDHFFLFRANDEASPIEKTKSVFEKVVAAEPRGERNFYLIDALTNEAIREGACGEAWKWLRAMESIDVKPIGEFYGNASAYMDVIRARVKSLLSCEETKTERTKNIKRSGAN